MGSYSPSVENGLPPKSGPTQSMADAAVNLTLFLDHSEVEFSGSIAHGGLVAGERPSSADGVWYPSALCGRTSL